MGFYPPDALVHEAQRRGVEVLPPCVVAQRRASAGSKDGAVRMGLGYVNGVKEARGPGAGGRARAGRRAGARSATSPARSGASAETLGRLAWAGACDALVDGPVERAPARRSGSWAWRCPACQVAGGHPAGAAARAARGPRAARAERLGADAGRLRLDRRDAARAPARADAARPARRPQHEQRRSRRHPHGRRVRVAGLVVARQRPATAKGVTFMLLEDEHGTINLIVPPPVHDRFRLAVRAEPLVLAAGRLERREGTTNVVVDRIERLDRPDLPLAKVTHIEPRRVWSSDAGELGRGRCRRRTASAAAARHHPGPMAGRILVGTSSWADPGFVKEWYPPKMPASERLPWYAQRFEYVELNSSFYAVPDRNTVHGWVEVTPAGFTFDVKAHRAAVAPLGAGRVAAARPARQAQTTARPRDADAELETALAERLVEETAPLAEAGKLGAYLLQLTPAFSPGKHELEELDGARRGPRAAPAWRSSCATATGSRDERREATLDWFADRGVAFVGVDAPPGDHFPIMPPIDAVTNPTTRLPARPRPQHRGLPDGQVGGRALRLALHGRRAGGDRRPRARAGRAAPARCTWRSTTTAATTRPRRRSASARCSARRRRSRSEPTQLTALGAAQLEPDALGALVLLDAPARARAAGRGTGPSRCRRAVRLLGLEARRVEPGPVVGDLGEHRRAGRSPP